MKKKLFGKAVWLPKVGDWVRERWTNATALVVAVNVEKKVVWLSRPTAIDIANIFATDLDKVERLNGVAYSLTRI